MSEPHRPFLHLANSGKPHEIPSSLLKSLLDVLRLAQCHPWSVPKALPEPDGSPSKEVISIAVPVQKHIQKPNSVGFQALLALVLGREQERTFEMCGATITRS